MAWSPDGTRFALATTDGLFVASADGSQRRRLTDHGFSVAWVPDGSGIAFFRWSGALTPVKIVAADGSGERAIISHLTDLQALAWAR